MTTIGVVRRQRVKHSTEPSRIVKLEFTLRPVTLRDQLPFPVTRVYLRRSRCYKRDKNILTGSETRNQQLYRSIRALFYNTKIRSEYFFPLRGSSQWVRYSSLPGLHDHTQTHHILQDSSGIVISPTRIPLPNNTQHSKETDIRAPGGIRSHNPSKRVAADPRLRPRWHWDRVRKKFWVQNTKYNHRIIFRNLSHFQTLARHDDA